MSSAQASNRAPPAPAGCGRETGVQWRPQDVRPGSQSLWIGYLMWQNGLGRCEGVRDLETGGAPGLSGGPTSSQLSSSQRGRSITVRGDARTEAEVRETTDTGRVI